MTTNVAKRARPHPAGPAGLGALLAISILAASAEAAPTFRKTITVNAGQVAGGPLTNFPFLFNTTDLSLRTTANGGNVTNANGWDIIFATAPTCADSTSCGGAKLDHEIERYNAVTGELVAWVRVPSIDNGTVFYLHYSDTAVVATTENRTGVWDASYQAVWHLSEAPANGTAGGHIDSKHNTTAGAFFNNGTPQGFTAAPSSTSGTGIAAGADRFYRPVAGSDASNNDTINVTDHATLEPAGDMTLETWVNANTLPAPGSGNVHLLAQKNDWTGIPWNSYQLFFRGDAGATRLWFGWTNSTLGPYYAVNPGPFSTGTWYHVAGVLTGNTVTLYVNGSAAGTSTAIKSGTLLNSAQTLSIGNGDVVGTGTDGILDEVRLSSSARPAGWLLTQYGNVSSPSTFYSLVDLPTLALANPPSGQVPDQLGTTTPVTATFFQLRLSRAATVTVDNLRVRFTTTGGVANGDVTAGELWEDTNGNGTWDGAGPDTLLQGSVTPSGGVLTFTTNFSPATAGTNYFVRATLSNLAAADTTTFSVAASDIDEVEGGVAEPGTISDAVHVQDYASGGDVYYSIGTSTADLKTGSPTITINNGTATLSVAQTGSVGVGDRVTFAGGPVFIKAVLSPTAFVVHTATGLVPANTGAVAVTSIMREFNTIAAAVTGSVDGTHLGNGNLVASDRKLTWVCYDDGPFNVAATTTISGYTTDATRYITLTVAGASQVVNGVSHRHNGTAGSGTVVEAGSIGGGNPVFAIAQAYTRFEWLEIDGNSFVSQDGLYVTGSNSILRYLIVHDIGANDSTNCPNAMNGCSAVIVAGSTSSVAIRNSFIYDYGQDGIDAGGTGTVIANTTVFRTRQSGEGLQVTGGTTTAENVLSLGNFADFCAQDFCSGTLTCNNCMSSDDSADNFLGAGNLINKVAANQLRSTIAPVDLHLKAGADALNAGKDLSGTFTDDIDGETRSAPWDIGADEFVPKVNYRSIGTAAPHSAGTITATVGSPIVTGVGTGWIAANRGRGDSITFGGFTGTILSVDSETQLTLTSAATVGGSPAYSISRKFATLTEWEDCIDGGGTSCGPDPIVNSASLVADDRSEVGIAYKDSVFTAGANVNVAIDGSTTDALHTITLTADSGNRHYGIAGTGVILDGGAATDSAVLVLDDFVTVEWLEIRNGGAGFDGVEWQSLAAVNKGVARNLLIHNLPDTAIQVQDALAIVDVYNNILYRNGRGFRNVSALTTGALRILNNTVFGSTATGGITASVVAPGLITLRNNIAHSNTGGDFNVPTPNAASSNNLASDATGITHSPAGGGLDSIALAALSFVSTTIGSENLHIQTGSAAANVAADLSNVFSFDIDGATRVNPWDIGADDILATTEVELLSFEARPFDGAVELSWETGSELNNLGFHVYRGSSATGPWERLTANLIPGLGSSPEGARYLYRDSPVSNGTTYYYLLEDVETTGGVERHGPVEATPNAQASVVDSTLPSAATTYGDPSATVLRVLSSGASEIRVELTTGGFYGFPREDGTVDIEVPGFTPSNGSPGLPVKLHWLEVVAGRKVKLVSVRAADVQALSLVPSGSVSSELEASWDGTQRLRRSRRQARGFATKGVVPQEAARVAEIAFQGDVKKALLELAPLRWDGATGRLLFARKLQVTLSFRSRDPYEIATGGGRRGRRARETAASRGVVARLATTEPGLHSVRYEELFRERGGRGGVDAGALRLSRLGKAVAFHLEPPTGRFAPGSTLHFVSEGAEANPYGMEAVYELETGRAGERMRNESAEPAGETLHELQASIEREEDRYYQAALVDAPDLWLWDMLLAPSVKVFPFSLSSLASESPAKLEVWLQGASDFPESPDHHTQFLVNGTYVGEDEWDGKEPRHVEITLPPGILREGENSLEIESLQNTGAPYSMLFLDRFQVTYPRLAVAAGGVASGRWDESGTAEVSAIGARARVLDVTQAAPRWLTGARYDSGSLRFRVEAGRSYLVVDSASVKSPEVRKARSARWKSDPPRADYLAIGPRELLDAARPLLDHRRSQGLAVASIPIDEIFDEMGYGERRPEAIRDFLTYAYHHWPGGIRYVLLLGDASYDFKDHLGTGAKNQVPALPIETSYLWTASDPTLAAVNGDDLLPDVAIGRLPASDASELRAMIDKILAYETSGRGLSAPVVLVTDDPDAAGDFDAGALDLMTSVLASRSVRHISLASLGAEKTRASILEAFDEGPSVVSYMGHGGIHLWASENIFSNDSMALLAPQGQEPIVNALDCLNGYFHFPFFDSLAEELLKADGKGAVAVFAPSGLSLNEPAHALHQALLRELLGGEHARLGDAVLAAQAKFLGTASFAELLTIYHVFGDPALRLE